MFKVDSDEEDVDIEVYSCVLRGNGHLARLDVAPGFVAFPRAMYLGESVVQCRHHNEPDTVNGGLGLRRRPTHYGRRFLGARRAAWLRLAAVGRCPPTWRIRRDRRDGYWFGSRFVYHVSCGHRYRRSDHWRNARRRDELWSLVNVVQARLKFDDPRLIWASSPSAARRIMN